MQRARKELKALEQKKCGKKNGPVKKKQPKINKKKRRGQHKQKKKKHKHRKLGELIGN